jgi:hypothetical protein
MHGAGVIDRVTGAAAKPRARLPASRRHRRWLLALAVAALLAQMAVAMVTTAVQQTPTIDEPVYVGTAVVYRQQHSLRYNPEHPPLGKLIIATGAALAHPRLDPAFAGDQTALGRQLLYESGNDPWRLMLSARLPVIVLTLLFGLVVFVLAGDLVGPVGGLTALALYAFSPDVIAHGSLATLDVPAAGFLLTSVWLLWRARRRPLLCLPLAGVALGAALATKMSTLAAMPVLLLLVWLSVWSARRTPGPGTGHPGSPGPATAGPGAAGPGAAGPGAVGSGTVGSGAVGSGAAAGSGAAGSGAAGSGAAVGSGAVGFGTAVGSGTAGSGTVAGTARLVVLGAAAAVVVALSAVVVVWAAYLAVDPRLRWTTPQNVPVIQGLRGQLVDWMPFPEPYRDGMRIQFGFEESRWGGFLFGRQYVGSRWYYLPAALLVKTPLGALALWAAGAAATVTVPRLRCAAPYVLLPAAVLLAAAMTGSRDLGVRYAIFMPMFLAVAAAGVTAVRRKGAQVATAALVAFVAVSSLLTYPYYLPYSNEAFGGPSKTHLNLHDSNVDWGQDLGRLADRLRQRYGGERIWLVYKGSGVPSSYGVKASDPLTADPDDVHGLLVVSDSAIAKAEGRLAALIGSSTPISEVGHSITIYRRK